MEQYIVLVLSLTSIMLFSYWFNYCMGTPLAKDRETIDPTAIFFFFPLWLADRRLKKLNLWREYKESLLEAWEVASDKVMREQLFRDNLRDRVVAAKYFFSWERSILCPVCFHWWLTVLFVVVYGSFQLFTGFDLLVVAFTYLVNHLFIRKI